MPPWSHWYLGREAIGRFFGVVWTHYGRFRLLPTQANGQPAFVLYTKGDAERAWRAHSLQVLGIEGDLDWNHVSGTLVSPACPGGSCSTSDTWLSTVRGRVGYAFDRVMPYVTGGLAAGDLSTGDQDACGQRHGGSSAAAEWFKDTFAAPLSACRVERPDVIVRARRLSRAVIHNIRQNLFFAFIFNGLAIPVAAGVLYPAFGLLLNPMIASAAMSMSSVLVITNALRLRRTSL